MTINDYVEKILNKDYNYHKKWGFWWVKKPKSQYEVEYNKALEIYKKEMLMYNTEYEKFSCKIQELMIKGLTKQEAMSRVFFDKQRPYFHVTKKEYVKFDLSFEEYRNMFYDKIYRETISWFFDGNEQKTGRNKGFKKCCKKFLRNRNKLLTNKIIRDIDVYDEVCFPDEKDCKKFIWSYY